MKNLRGLNKQHYHISPSKDYLYYTDSDNHALNLKEMIYIQVIQIFYYYKCMTVAFLHDGKKGIPSLVRQ